MYKVGVTGKFTAVHALEGDVPEEEKHPHPHDYLLEWILDVGSLDERGFSLDISVLEDIRDGLFGYLDGRNLNEDEYFHGRTTSLENLCGFIYSFLLSELKKRSASMDFNRIVSMEIRVWENSQAWAGVIEKVEH